MNDRGRKYRIMLTNLSGEIVKRNVCLDMLKAASVDFVNVKTELQNAKKPFDIFKLLDTTGHISQNNPILLIAMIQLLGLNYLKDVIETSGFKYTENVDTKTVFSLFRRRVINIGKGLTYEHVDTISGVYQVPNANCSNQWRLLQYLQDNKIFNNNDELTEFIRTVSSVGVIVDDVDQLTPARSSTVNCDAVGHSSATSSGSTCDDVDQLTPAKSSTVNCDVIGHSSATSSGSACDVVDQLTPAKSSTVDCDVIGHLSATPSGSACDEATFSDLRYLVADWYETREKINKLRILLRDVLKNDNVNKIKDCLEFFEKLYAVGKLHSKNLTIIYELIKCTGDLGLERKIREIVPSCPNIRDIAVAEISMFRLKLQDFGNMLCESDVNAIDGLYNLPRKKYKDAWCLIIDLEYRGLIREGSLEDFIKKLEKHSLGHAAAKLR